MSGGSSCGWTPPSVTSATSTTWSPISSSRSVEHSAHASTASWSSASPLSVGRQRTSLNLSSSFEAKSRQSSLRPSPTKLTTKRPLARSAASVREARSTQTRIVGGSAETLQTAVVVSPRGVPSAPSVVTIATPDGNEAMTSKNAWRSIVTGKRSTEDGGALDLDQASRDGEAGDADDRLGGVRGAARAQRDRHVLHASSGGLT